MHIHHVWPHLEETASHMMKRAWLYKMINFNIEATNNDNENLRGYHLETVSGNFFFTRGLNQVLLLFENYNKIIVQLKIRFLLKHVF